LFPDCAINHFDIGMLAPSVNAALREK